MENQTVMNLVRNEAIKVIAKGNEIFYPHAEIDPFSIEISFALRGAVAGQANYKNRLLKFNLVLASENLVSFLNDTVPHEVAHLFQRAMYPQSKPHGIEFKRVMLKLGYNPTRCHSYDTQNVKRTKNIDKNYIYKCNCREHALSKTVHNNLLKSRGRRWKVCRLCRGKLIFQGYK